MEWKGSAFRWKWKRGNVSLKSGVMAWMSKENGACGATLNWTGFGSSV